MRHGMIATTCCIMVWWIAIPSSAQAAADDDKPTCPPEFAIAVIADEQTLEIHRTVQRAVKRTTNQPNLKTGGERGTLLPTTASEVVPVVETHVTSIDLASISARRIDGEVVSKEGLRRALKKQTPILVVKQGWRIEPLFAALIKPDSLVIELPAPISPATVLPNSAVRPSRSK